MTGEKRTERELADALAKLHDAAGHGDKTLAVHLFGLIYADEIRGHGPGAAGRIARASGIGDEYTAELNKMMRVAPHVIVGTAETSRLLVSMLR